MSRIDRFTEDEIHNEVKEALVDGESTLEKRKRTKGLKEPPNKKPKKQRSKFRKFMRGLGIFFLSMFLVGVLLCVGAYIKVKPIMDEAMSIAYDKMVDIDENTFMRLKDTVIYDANGEKMGEINIGNFQYAEITEISKYIQDGYIAVEDRNFKTHNGIDIKAIARAGVALIKNKGEVTQGGSTITQQVLKNNVIGTDINKWERKIIEIFLAPSFEKMFTKAQIMEFYCNSNFYQNNCYGVETASRYYFGKSAADVSLAEAAGMVGLSNNPAAYNPVKHPEAYLEKRHFVLTTMLEQGVITQEEFEQADKEELNLVLEREAREKESYPVSFALHCAALELMEEDGFVFKYAFSSQEEYDEYKAQYEDVYSDKANEIRGGGYTIYTTLDMEKQAKLQEIIDSETSRYTEKAEDGRYTLQSAATLVNNNTGYIEAIVGGRGTDDEYNRGYQSARQPGSSIKPLVVYAPAFETGRYYPSLKIKDEPIENGPKNAGGGYRGNTSIREAIGRSINTIPYKILQDIKPSTGVSYLSNMKFSHLSYLDQFNGSMALGGFTYGTTTVEMAKGYATLGNAGTYLDNNCLKKVEYQDGRVVYDGEINRTQVFTADTSYMIIDCLKGVINEYYGTGKLAAVPNQIVAGKTGTTNSNKDIWFCGLYADYSLAVWTGYDQPRETSNVHNVPAKVFSRMMTYLTEGKEAKDFVKPETVYEAYVDYKGNEVDYRSGTMDLFSKTAQERLLEEQREAEEKARKEAEEKARQAEENLIEKLKLDIDGFSNYVIETKDDVIYLDESYNSIVNQINSISSFETRESLLALLDSYYEAFNKLSYVNEYRNEIAAEQKKLREEAEQRRKEEEEREARLKEARIEAAEKALSNLENWSEHNYKELLETSEIAISMCKDYSEYSNMYTRYERLKAQIDKYFEPEPTVPEVPDLDETNDEGITQPYNPWENRVVPIPWEDNPQNPKNQNQQNTENVPVQSSDGQ